MTAYGDSFLVASPDTITDMLVINGVITINPARRSDVIAAAIVMQVASQAEPGCHHYVFSSDLARDDVFYVTEKWEDLAALDVHFATETMATFQKSIAGAVVGSKVTKYEIASEGPVR